MDITTFLYLLLAGIDISLGLIYAQIDKKEIATIWFILAILNFLIGFIYFHINNKKPPTGFAY